jgi:uncharacterized membrane protein YoaT (DUF817 family)
MDHPFSNKETAAALFAAAAVVSLNATATTWAYPLPRVALMLISGGSILIAISFFGFPLKDIDRDSNGALKRIQIFMLILGLLLGGGNFLQGLWKLSKCAGHTSLECSYTDSQLSAPNNAAP